MENIVMKRYQSTNIRQYELLNKRASRIDKHDDNMKDKN